MTEITNLLNTKSTISVNAKQTTNEKRSPKEVVNKMGRFIYRTRKG